MHKDRLKSQGIYIQFITYTVNRFVSKCELEIWMREWIQQVLSLCI